MDFRAYRGVRVPMLRQLTALLLPAGLIASCYVSLGTWRSSSISVTSEPFFQRGMSYTAWSYQAYSNADSDESLNRMMEVNIDWVAVCVWWFQDQIDSTKIYPRPDMYTASNNSVAHAIDRAHELGLKVMLKPMVDPVGLGWRGMIPGSPEWFESYADFIYFFAEMAEIYGVELFCVGCEFNANDISTPYWRDIISGVRSRYSGPLTYAASPGHEQQVEWWDAVDYIGIDAYYPLTDSNEPTREQLRDRWTNIADYIEAWQMSVGKPVIFTEIGYRSGDGSNNAPWDWREELAVDLEEQADCYEAVLSVLWNRTWFYGFYWWNWETNPSAGGAEDNGYTPQNKPAQEVLAEWYAKSRGDPLLFPIDGQWCVCFVVMTGAKVFQIIFSSRVWLGNRSGSRVP